ncbi:hypothetical protein [[Limnothrix rosea] IAM M-220]|uniref:hypothetical protein n=1 Tax=[Limnothrix rosea] IAM M-220 TaxID=454133 RepID=UPI0009612927|nr:hypothetical protein [[Limnothrix rosea] IAM M-220]OKH17090.1 hypothetical protein NIES208_10895 [[Limnothrix rosea] IAM M-220]
MNKVWLSIATLTLAIAPEIVQAQSFDLNQLPTKNYQSYPREIPEKKWTSLFFQASRLYERSQALNWEEQYFSEAITLNNEGSVLGWYRKDGDDENQHFLVRTNIQNCLNNRTSHSVLFVERWDGRNLNYRRNSYSYERVDSLAVKEICDSAIAEHKKRI